MSTGISNRFSFIRANGFKALGLAVLTAGLFLGGCNNKLKEENAQLRDQNSEFKDKLTATETEKATLSTQLQQTQSENSSLKTQLATAPTSGNGGGGDWNTPAPRQPHAPRDSQTFTIAGDALFASGSVTLKSDAKKSLDKLMSQLRSAHSIRIEGYTDSDPIKHSKFPSNVALSKARADAVKTYLVGKGVSKSKIETVGKGAAEPKSTKAQSRRVEIVVAD